MTEFDGLVALVTGGGAGLGAAVATRLSAAGASVAILDIDLSTADPAYFAVEADVTDDASVRGAVAAVAEKFGRIDILVNNVGIGAEGDITANDDDEWMRVLNVNVLGIVRVTRAALPFLRRSGSASIVNTASVVATMGLPQRALYSASKGAVAALTRAMAADHLSEGIRVNSVNPGTADTPWVARLLAAAPNPEAERKVLEARQPHGRLVSAAEVADAVVYLASPRSGSTTGTSVAVDGGMQNIRPRSS
jgi:NAD(P)-dependent dehydrogenase (short-subunit alcohol dehydrogenase family)